MTILTLRFKDRKIKDYALTRGQQLAIGRNNDNDIVIDSLSVSGYHARIESVASKYVLKDLDSTNGVFVNNERMKMHVLQHNDTVLIGKHELVFDQMIFDRSARVTKSSSADEVFEDDKTRFLDTREHRELTQQAIDPNTTISSESAIQSKQGRRGFFSSLLKKVFG